jgi:hypothetical protein
MSNEPLSPQTARGGPRRRPIGVRVALAAMDGIARLSDPHAMGRLPVSQVGKVLGALIAVAVAVVGWFALVILASFSAMTMMIVTLVVVPLLTGGLAASIGHHPKFRWPLLGFVLPLVMTVVSTPRPGSNGEGSGFVGGAVDITFIGLPFLFLGFSGWLWIRRVWPARPRSTRDIRRR